MEHPAVIVTLHLLAAAACVWIAVQDFRSRAVSVWLFLLLGMLGLFHTMGQMILLSLVSALFNCAIVAVMVGMIALWQKLRGRSLMSEGLGLGAGDIALLVAAGCWLGPVTYLVFVVASLWVVLAASLLWRKWKGLDGQWPIPLAGGQALLFIPALAVSVLGGHPFAIDEQFLLPLFISCLDPHGGN